MDEPENRREDVETFREKVKKMVKAKQNISGEDSVHSLSTAMPNTISIDAEAYEGVTLDYQGDTYRVVERGGGKGICLEVEDDC